MLSTVGQDLCFNLPLEQVVGGLGGVQRSHLAKPIHLFGGKVADPNGADLALLQQLPQKRRRFFDRFQGIRPMNLVEIDHICLQAAQRILQFLGQARQAGVAHHFVVCPLQSRFI
jgi:hypothetical protein